MFVDICFAFDEPDEINIFEFRQQNFSVISVTVKIMFGETVFYIGLVYRKIVIPVFFIEYDLNIRIKSEIKIEQFIDLQAKFIAFDRSDQSDETGVFEKLIVGITGI